jgi:hypothetical protein
MVHGAAVGLARTTIGPTDPLSCGRQRPLRRVRRSYLAGCRLPGVPVVLQIEDVLPGGELVSSGFLRRPPLREMVTDQRSGRRDQSKQLWQLLSMELWYRGALAAGVAPP